MTSLNDFARETRLSASKINYIASRAKHLYQTYEVPKKNGKSRLIAQPSRDLKALQSWILRNILDKLSSSSHSKGFEIGTSILDNAKPHIGSHFVLTIDFENFFPNVTASKVFGVFDSIGYNKEMCVLLTNICVYEGGLPQGSPASPKLANLVCAKLDSRIHGYTGPKGIVYTRYADDITLSAQTVQKIYKAKDFIGTIISDEGLKINKSKTKICGTTKQKKITGLILSEKGVGIGQKKFKDIRIKIYYLFTEQNSNYSNVNGLLAFTYSVDKKAYKRLYTYIDKLMVKFPLHPTINKLHPKINN